MEQSSTVLPEHSSRSATRPSALRPALVVVAGALACALTLVMPEFAAARIIVASLLGFAFCAVALLLIEVERRRCDAESARERLDRLVNGSTELSVIVSDASGRVELFSHGAETLTGYSADEVVGESTADFLHLRHEVTAVAGEPNGTPGTDEHSESVLQMAARRQSGRARPWTYVQRDGKHRPVVMSLSTWASAPGAPEGTLEIAMALSERSRNERSSDRGESNDERWPTDPTCIALAVEQQQQSRAKEKGLDLRIRCARAVPTLLLDSNRLRLGLERLVDDALRNTDHGEVRIDIDAIPEGDHRHRLRIDVIDSGPGTNTNEAFPIVVQQLIERMGGTLRTERVPGAGSRVTLEFLAENAPIGATPDPVDRGRTRDTDTAVVSNCRRSLEGRSILVIERGNESRALLEEALRAAGAQCVVAARGTDEPRVWRSKDSANAPFDAVVLDARIDGAGRDRITALRKSGFEGTILLYTVNPESSPAAEPHSAREIHIPRPLGFPQLVPMLADSLRTPLRRAAAARTEAHSVVHLSEVSAVQLEH